MGREEGRIERYWGREKEYAINTLYKNVLKLEKEREHLTERRNF